MNKKASLYLCSSQAIRTALRKGHGRCLYVKKTQTPQVVQMEQEATSAGVAVRTLDAGLGRLHGARSVLLEASLPPSVDLSAWAGELADTVRVAVLDRIQDPHNVGAILRSAAFFAFDLVIISQHKSAAITSTVAHTSSGALYLVPTVAVRDVSQTLKLLKKHSFTIYATTAEGRSLPSDDTRKRVALVVGNEQSGVSSRLQALCDDCVGIAPRGELDSLNASVAAGLCFYELVRTIDSASSRE